MKQYVTIRMSEDEEPGKRVLIQNRESLLELLLRQEKEFLSFCGGKGMCGRCKVQFLTAPPLPRQEERKFLAPEELRKGIRLACLCHPTASCTIMPLFRENEMREERLREKIVSKHVELRQHHFNWDKAHQKAKILAIDLGTTTIVLQLREAMSGRIITEERMMNPQRAFGIDVVARMAASMQGKRERLQQIISDALADKMNSILQGEQANIVLAGNTVMVHLLLGLDMTQMSVYPFKPLVLGETVCHIGKYTVTILPGIAGFVGGDITAGVYATGMDLRMSTAVSAESNEKADGKNDVTLHKAEVLLDLGTNGEMVICDGKRMLATATAAGPAFEGIVTDTQGTDLIAITADLLEQGILDETGLLSEPYFTEGYSTGELKIVQSDIRALQMAKAAIHAGLQILLEELKLTAKDIRNVYLAGGFGYLLDVEKAERIHLFPEGLAEKTVAVGNTSLQGAFLYGQALLYEKQLGEKKSNNPLHSVRNLIEKTEVINLAEIKTFEAYYIQALHFK